MKRFIFTGIIILFVMAGCGGDHSSTDGLITVDVNDSYSTKKELVLQDFMDVEYIPLETNDEFINRACVQAVGEKYIIVTNFYDDGLNQRSEKSSFYVEMLDYDKDNLICYDKFNFEVPFLLVSKQDGSITKEITVPYKEKQLFHIVERLYDKGETRAAGPGPYNSIIPFKGNWILFEASSDTVYTLMPDYSLRPLIARTPPIHTMDPGVFVVLRLISDRYYFMESVTNIYDFNTGEGFSKQNTAYDTQEKKFFNYITYNDDYSYKKEIYMVTFPPINSKGELCSTINASELCQDYKRGKLKDKLKEVAATLEEDDNRVVVLVRPKK